MAATPTRPPSSSSSSSIPPPYPKSPPQYPDLYGKRRQAAKLQMLDREIGFLEVYFIFFFWTSYACHCQSPFFRDSEETASPSQTPQPTLVFHSLFYPPYTILSDYNLRLTLVVYCFEYFIPFGGWWWGRVPAEASSPLNMFQTKRSVVCWFACTLVPKSVVTQLICLSCSFLLKGLM